MLADAEGSKQVVVSTRPPQPMNMLATMLVVNSLSMANYNSFGNPLEFSLLARGKPGFSRLSEVVKAHATRRHAQRRWRNVCGYRATLQLVTVWAICNTWNLPLSALLRRNNSSAHRVVNAFEPSRDTRCPTRTALLQFKRFGP